MLAFSLPVLVFNFTMLALILPGLALSYWSNRSEVDIPSRYIVVYNYYPSLYNHIECVSAPDGLENLFFELCFL